MFLHPRFVLPFAALLIGCSGSDPSESRESSVDVNSAEVVWVRRASDGVRATLRVTGTTSTTCDWQFVGAPHSDEGRHVYVEVIVSTDDHACGAAFQDHEYEFDLRLPNPGTYTFHFESGERSFDTLLDLAP